MLKSRYYVNEDDNTNVNTMATSQHNIKPFVPEKVRWGPSDGFAPGIRVWNSDDTEESFISWTDLKPELESRLFPQLFADPSGYTIESRDYHGKKQWLVRICNEAGEPYCAVWFGDDPDNGWRFDGLIRVGEAMELESERVWHVYQRYSDGTYRRLFALTPVIDEITRQYKR